MPRAGSPRPRPRHLRPVWRAFSSAYARDRTSRRRPREIGESARVVAEGTLAGLPCVHVLEAAGPGGTSAALRELLPLRADRVVSLSLVGIAEDLVGLIDLFELFFRVRFLVDVRVVLACELAVRLLDVLGRSVLR